MKQRPFIIIGILITVMLMGVESAWGTIHTAAFYVNGNKISEASVEEGSAIVFPADPSPMGGKVFMGWIKTAINGTTNTAPTSYFTSDNMGDADQDYFAVFATRTETIKWKRLDVDKLEGTGIYAMINIYNNAFNGEINSNGHGLVTTTAFSFINGYATTAPAGTLELTLTAVSGGYTMSANGKYLYATAKSNGRLDWKDSETSCWSTESNSAYWRYTNGAHLRAYGSSSFRIYSSGTSASPISFAKKVTLIEYSDYCTNISPLTKDIYTTGWATYVPAYPVQFREGTTAYIVKAIENTTDQVALWKVTSVPAETPILLEGAPGTHSMDVLASAPSVSGNLLQVSDGTVSGDNVYVLATGSDGVGFYKWSGSAADLKGRVYLQLPTGARPFIALPGEEAGIDTIDHSPLTIEDGVYDLNGQRVQKPRKGLYIVNGRKVLVK